MFARNNKKTWKDKIWLAFSSYITNIFIRNSVSTVKRSILCLYQRTCDLADDDEVEDAFIVFEGGTGILQNPAASKTGSSSRTLPGIDPSNIL